MSWRRTFGLPARLSRDTLQMMLKLNSIMQEHSGTNQWRCIISMDNLAHDASRRISYNFSFHINRRFQGQ